MMSDAATHVKYTATHKRTPAQRIQPQLTFQVQTTRKNTLSAQWNTPTVLYTSRYNRLTLDTTSCK